MFKVKLILKFLIMKNLANLNGAKALSKKEQKSINGGGQWCAFASNQTPCGPPTARGCCRDGKCLPPNHPFCAS
jgi:hypothetical protein